MMPAVKTPGEFQEQIIGQSAVIKRLLATVAKIAGSASITTLIVGESGTGKEMVARRIHELNATPEQPFVDINCGAIPETLLESELFGYEKGAFTGAETSKKGLFELANGGTIFLDEIDNTSLNFQTKLLKAVEYKRFRRINGLAEIQVSTRIIAATNIDLMEAIRAGRFREDLYYRLNVCQIYVPPLRSRGDDVLILAQYFIERFNREYEREVKGLAPSAVKVMKSYAWPGNIRQLKNAIERAVLVECDEWIEAEHLMLDPDGQSKNLWPESDQTAPPVTVVNSDFKLFEIPAEGISLEKVERDLILSALARTNGNVSRAARLLQINRGKLRYRMERLGITSQNIHELKAKSFS